MDVEHQNALISELKIMIYIGNHINVLSLIGAITKQMVKGELYVIMEYCKLGQLGHYLKARRGTFVNELITLSPISPPPRPTLVQQDGYLLPNTIASFSSAVERRSHYQVRLSVRKLFDLGISNSICKKLRQMRCFGLF